MRKNVLFLAAREDAGLSGDIDMPIGCDGLRWPAMACDKEWGSAVSDRNPASYSIGRNLVWTDRLPGNRSL